MHRDIGIILIIVFALLLCACSTQSQSASIIDTVPEPTEMIDKAYMAEEIPAAESFDGGSGTDEDPYQIKTAEQLALLAKYVNERNEEFAKACYIQTADIVMNDTADLVSWCDQAPRWRWAPIGTNYLSEFQGHYDGAGYSISGMYINYSNENDNTREKSDVSVGLFGCVYNGTVENVILVDSYVSSDGTYDAAGIVGKADYSQIRNCMNTATVEAQNTSFVGGICGGAYNESAIANCVNTGTINGMGSTNNGYPNVGGICGSGYNISECNNIGIISGSGDVGGICGGASGVVDNCDNSGIIASWNSAGGIAGNGGTMIHSCHNSGDVTAGTPEIGGTGAGGIVGSTLGSITDCVNDGTVTSVEGAVQPSVGGIAGFWGGNYDEGIPAFVTNCTNNGRVQTLAGWAQCGGIVGYASTGKDSCSIENCINYANICAAEGDAGGIAGCIYAANGHALEVVDCINYGKFSSGTESTDYAGGICGYANPWGGTIRIERCRNEADVSGTGCAGLSSAVIIIEEGTFECIDCVNTGNVTVQGSHVGGLFCIVSGSSGNVRIESCQNEGNVASKDTMFVGGLVGHLDGKEIELINCMNEGNVTVDNARSVQVGGIIGAVVSFETLCVDNCSNHGDLVVNSDDSISTEIYENNPDWYYFLVGGITGCSKGPEYYINCSNTGILTVTGNGRTVPRTGDIIGQVLPD